MTVQDVIDAADRFAPPGFAYEWDRAGLATGHPEAEVSTVLVTLTVTPDAFEAAVKAHANMIVAHHPLIWEPLKSLREDDPVARLCVEIAAAGIACYSAHTSLDVVPDGVNHVLADRLDLIDVAQLIEVPHAKFVKLVTFVPDADLVKVRTAICDAGAGTIGDYTQCSFSTEGIGTFIPGENADPHVGKKNRLNEEPERRLETLVHKARLPTVLEALLEAHPYEDVAYDIVELANVSGEISLGLRGRLRSPTTLDRFAAHICRALEVSHVRVSGDPQHKVRTVGVLGGSGSGAIEQIPDDIDVFVTGDVKYHDALSALDRGIAVIDASHHGTEKWIVPALAQYLKDTLNELRVGTFIEPETFRAVTA